MSGFGKDGKGVILNERAVITLGALGSSVTKKSDSQLTFGEDFRLIKSEYWVAYEGLTAGETPIIIGIADNELSVTEIAECLAAAPVDRNDNLGNEQAHRPVFPFAVIPDHNDGIRGALNNGKAIEKTLRWTFSDTEGFTLFAHNDTGATLTTGGIIRIRAKHYGVWVT